MVRKHVVDEVIRWWREAPQEVRAVFVSRYIVDASKVRNPDAPTAEEAGIAIYLADFYDGEVEGEKASEIGQRVRGGQSLHGEDP